MNHREHLEYCKAGGCPVRIAIARAWCWDRVMESPDMFEDGTVQVFSVRTGERVRTDRPEQVEARQIEDPAQLTMDI